MKSKTSKILSLLLVALAFGPAVGADVKVRFEGKMEREVWVLAEMPKAMPTGGRAFTTEEIAVPISKENESGVIVAYIPKSGMVATKKVALIENGVWVVEKDEWRIGQVRIEVFSRGEPIPKGTVQGSKGDYSRTQPVESGAATFFAVPFGDVQFVVKYVSGGADKASPAQVFRMPATRDELVPTFAITIRDSIDKDVAAAPKPEAERSPFVTGIAWLVALGIGAGALYFILRAVRSNEETVAGGLQKLGVQIPGTATPHDEAAAEPFEAAPLVPDGHCQYCGQAFAEDGSCACKISSTPATVLSPSPRLIGNVTFEIADGLSVLGREAELQVADPTVSRKHAEIERRGDAVFIRDAGSANGTFVNGQRVDAETELHSGDTVQFGAVKFRFEG
ncbi:MAG: FHA domain-containing protein [Fimbriimonadales bacterium]